MEVNEVLEAPEVKLPPLTVEERHDLRRRVLAGYKMNVEEAQRVYETLRAGQGIAVLTGEATKKSRKKKESLTDEQLNADLDSLGL